MDAARRIRLLRSNLRSVQIDEIRPEEVRTTMRPSPLLRGRLFPVLLPGPAQRYQSHSSVLDRSNALRLPR